MVKAILEGRKTMARRVITPQPKRGLVRNYAEDRRYADEWVYPDNDASQRYEEYRLPENFTDADRNARWTPKFHAEDILWVKENWIRRLSAETEERCPKFLYRADYNSSCGLKWRRSALMPFEAARIFLRVNNVSMERLQDITDGDAEREGVCYSALEDFGLGLLKCAPSAFNPRYPFALYWNSLRKKIARNRNELDKSGWDANPWVWVISFERCGKPEDAIVKEGMS